MTTSPPAETKSSWSTRIAAIAFLAVASLFYLRTVHYSAPAHVELSTLALQNLDGTPLPPQTTQGKPVLLNFWASWCGPCRLELPWLQRLQASHPDLIVLGVADDPDDLPGAIALVSRNHISYPMARTSPSIRTTFGHVVSLPTTLYISRSGKVIHTITGLIPEPLMKRYANEAIAAD